jgi:transposase
MHLGGGNIGIDVAKDSVDVCFGLDEKVCSYATTSCELDRLVRQLSRRPPEPVVLEATGGSPRAWPADRDGRQ